MSRLLFWAVLLVLVIGLFVYAEDHWHSHGVCDDIHGGCPGVTPTATR